MFGYGIKKNIPKNVHDITRARLSYSVVSTNLRRMMPKSLVSSVISFADQLQLSHLKLQQAIAKAKPDGLIVDIEGLENVQLGKGGELQPLDIQDIYEQTGVILLSFKESRRWIPEPSSFVLWTIALGISMSLLLSTTIISVLYVILQVLTK